MLHHPRLIQIASGRIIIELERESRVVHQRVYGQKLFLFLSRAFGKFAREEWSQGVAECLIAMEPLTDDSFRFCLRNFWMRIFSWLCTDWIIFLSLLNITGTAAPVHLTSIWRTRFHKKKKKENIKIRVAFNVRNYSFSITKYVKADFLIEVFYVETMFLYNPLTEYIFFFVYPVLVILVI